MSHSVAVENGRLKLPHSFLLSVPPGQSVQINITQPNLPPIKVVIQSQIVYKYIQIVERTRRNGLNNNINMDQELFVNIPMVSNRKMREYKQARRHTQRPG